MLCRHHGGHRSGERRIDQRAHESRVLAAAKLAARNSAIPMAPHTFGGRGNAEAVQAIRSREAPVWMMTVIHDIEAGRVSRASHIARILNERGILTHAFAKMHVRALGE